MKTAMLRLEVHVEESRKDAALEALQSLVEDGEIRTALEGIAGTRGDDVEVTYERVEYSFCCQMMQTMSDRIGLAADDAEAAKIAREFAQSFRSLARPVGYKRG